MSRTKVTRKDLIKVLNENLGGNILFHFQQESLEFIVGADVENECNWDYRDRLDPIEIRPLISELIKNVRKNYNIDPSDVPLFL
jgi:hypothetical protein